MEQILRERPEGSQTMSPKMVQAGNYYRWIADQFKPMLGQRVLDIGGGYGTHLQYIVSDRRFVMSVDISEEMVQRLKHKFSNQAIFDAKVVDFETDAGIAELAALNFDTITICNVLEHIDRDELALRAMYQILKPQRGRIFLQVPAHQWLYGQLDSLAGHHRRYTRKGLAQVLTAAGFEVERVWYFNAFGVIPWFINGRIFRPKSLGEESIGLQVVIFDRYILPVVRPIEQRIGSPVGQSVMAIAHAR